MKKSWRIFFIVTGSIVFLGIAFFLFSYFSVHKSQKLEGAIEAIPDVQTQRDSLQSGKADWPNWRGPNFDGKSSLKGIQTDWSDGLTKKWEVNYLCQGQRTASWSAPVILGNQLVISGRSETHDLAFCIDTETGELIWQGSYEAEAEKAHGPGPRATPCIDGAFVYTFGRSGDLVCWRMKDGKMVWRKNVHAYGGKAPEHGHSSSPVVYKDIVVVQGGGSALVCGFDKFSGELKWKSLEGLAGFAGGILLQTKKDTSFLVYTGLGVSSIDEDTGKELWRAPFVFEMNATTPVVSGNLVFNTAFTQGCQLGKFTKNKYELLWKNDAIAAHHSDPVILDGYIYGYSGFSGSNRGTFKCLDLKTGEEKWSTRELGQGTCTYVDNHLICMDVKGNLFLVEPDPETFKRIGTIENALGEVRYQAWTVPVVANGNLYLRYMQNLICYDLMN